MDTQTVCVNFSLKIVCQKTICWASISVPKFSRLGDMISASIFLLCAKRRLKIDINKKNKGRKLPPSVRLLSLGPFFYKKEWDHTLSSDTWSCLAWLFCPEALELSLLLGCESSIFWFVLLSFSVWNPRDCNKMQAPMALVENNPFSILTPDCCHWIYTLSLWWPHQRGPGATRRALTPFWLAVAGIWAKQAAQDIQLFHSVSERLRSSKFWYTNICCLLTI